MEEGKIRRGFLGVSLRTGADDNGATVGSVVSGSAADKAGFLPGDKILKVDNKAVQSVNQARVAISQTVPGKKIPVEVIRNNENVILYVILGSMSEELSPIPGIELTPLNSKIERLTKYPHRFEGFSLQIPPAN